MTYKFITTETRPNHDVKFYMFPDEYLDLTTPYRQNGKLISTSMTYTNDDLSLVKTVEWDNIESWQEFCAIPLAKYYLEIRGSYNMANKITFEKTVV